MHTIPLAPEAPFLKPAESVSLQFTGTGPDKERQEASHPHQVVLHPARDELLIPDLGADKTWRLRKNAKGAWEIAGHVSYKPGSGPRHLAFHSASAGLFSFDAITRLTVALSDDILYTALELTSEVTAHRVPPLPAQPIYITSVPTMASFPGPPAELGMLAAEILLPAPNKTFPTPYLYVSNRNDPSPEGDVIAVYDVSDAEKVAPVAEIRSGLKHLRGMVFGGPDDKYLVAGGANGNGVKVFERIDGGKGLKVVAALDLEANTRFLWA